jgi:hypothetical protein
MQDIMVPTAPGELIDKLTILRLKSEQITDTEKLAHVRHEQSVLQAIADKHLTNDPALIALWDQLYAINGDLWVIEDDIRMFEAKGDFGPGFIALARAVYVTNDQRAAIKKEINLLLGSAIVEEKSYYDDGQNT